MSKQTIKRSMHEDAIIKPLLCRPTLKSSLKAIQGKKEVLEGSKVVECPSNPILLARRCPLYLAQNPSVTGRWSQCLAGIRETNEDEEVDTSSGATIRMDASCSSISV